MSARHTPGPWAVDWGATRLDIHANGVIVAMIRRDSPDAVGNALLIGASADLLAGAALLMDAAPKHMTYRNAKERRAYEVLREAIAKAGRSAA